MTTAPAHISTIASFPEHFFLENLAVRADGSILVTVLNHKQLWYLPAPDGGQPVTPALVHTFENFPTGIAETEPDIFNVSAAGLASLSAATFAAGSREHPCGRRGFSPSTSWPGSTARV